MKFTSFTHVLVLASISSLTSVFANPVDIQTRDVYSPKVLTPQDGDVWEVGTYQVVTWDAYNAPTNVSNPYATIFLGKGNTITKTALASNFPVTQGYQEVKVPNVPYRDDYFVVVYGTSGSTSRKFTIV